MDTWELLPIDSKQLAPTVLPPMWEMHRGGYFLPDPIQVDPLYVLAVMFSVELCVRDGSKWVHVSCSRRHKTPDHDDLCLVKDLFIGRQLQAVHVFPPSNEKVNHHPNCLHLFARLDARAVPYDFRRKGTL